MSDRDGGMMRRRGFLTAVAAGGVALTGFRWPRLLDRDVPGLRPFRMAVLGDSVMWGQGLREQEKYWKLTRDWLEQQLGRPVHVQVFAHSGAVIHPDGVGDQMDPLHGEVPHKWPSVVRQASLVEQPETLDFVLMNGGANDADLAECLNPARTPQWIRDRMQPMCGERMKALLCYAVGRFPNARIMVTNYYPLVSQQSFADAGSIALIITTLFNSFSLAQASEYLTSQWAVQLAKSYTFSNESTQWLGWAVDETNRLFPERVALSRVDIDGDRCLGAPNSHIWGLEHDPVRVERSAHCVTTGKMSLLTMTGFNPDFDSKCPIASLLHPNALGARRYFEAVTAQLGPFLATWRQV
jgi:hypothetical protein